MFEGLNTPLIRFNACNQYFTIMSTLISFDVIRHANIMKIFGQKSAVVYESIWNSLYLLDCFTWKYADLMFLLTFLKERLEIGYQKNASSDFVKFT